MSGFCLVLELAWGGSVNHGATRYFFGVSYHSNPGTRGGGSLSLLTELELLLRLGNFVGGLQGIGGGRCQLQEEVATLPKLFLGHRIK